MILELDSLDRSPQLTGDIQRVLAMTKTLVDQGLSREFVSLDFQEAEDSGYDGKGGQGQWIVTGRLRAGWAEIQERLKPIIHETEIPYGLYHPDDIISKQEDKGTDLIRFAISTSREARALVSIIDIDVYRVETAINERLGQSEAVKLTPPYEPVELEGIGLNIPQDFLTTKETDVRKLIDLGLPAAEFVTGHPIFEGDLNLILIAAAQAYQFAITAYEQEVFIRDNLEAAEAAVGVYLFSHKWFETLTSKGLKHYKGRGQICRSGAGVPCFNHKTFFKIYGATAKEFVNVGWSFHDSLTLVAIVTPMFDGWTKGSMAIKNMFDSLRSDGAKYGLSKYDSLPALVTKLIFLVYRCRESRGIKGLETLSQLGVNLLGDHAWRLARGITRIGAENIKDVHETAWAVSRDRGDAGDTDRWEQFTPDSTFGERIALESLSSLKRQSQEMGQDEVETNLENLGHALRRMGVTMGERFMDGLKQQAQATENAPLILGDSGWGRYPDDIISKLACEGITQWITDNHVRYHISSFRRNLPEGFMALADLTPFRYGDITVGADTTYNPYGIDSNSFQSISLAASALTIKVRTAFATSDPGSDYFVNDMGFDLEDAARLCESLRKGIREYYFTGKIYPFSFRGRSDRGENENHAVYGEGIIHGYDEENLPEMNDINVFSFTVRVMGDIKLESLLPGGGESEIPF